MIRKWANTGKSGFLLGDIVVRDLRGTEQPRDYSKYQATGSLPLDWNEFGFDLIFCSKSDVFREKKSVAILSLGMGYELYGLGDFFIWLFLF